jgi:hypothetical protein
LGLAQRQDADPQGGLSERVARTPFVASLQLYDNLGVIDNKVQDQGVISRD